MVPGHHGDQEKSQYLWLDNFPEDIKIEEVYVNQWGIQY